MMGISIWQLLILLLIVMLLFGTKRLRNLGNDLGSAVKGFKKGIAETEEDMPKLESEEADGVSTAQENSTEKQD